MGDLRLAAPYRGVTARQRSPWIAEALAKDDEAPLSRLAGENKADVCIVGGGFTGLWTAMELLERAPGTSVTLLEADICGSGASGANAGYIMNLWPKLPSLEAMCARDEATWLGDESARALRDVSAFARDAPVELGFRATPWVWAATSSAQLDAWTDTLDALHRAGRNPLRVLDAQQASAVTGSQVTCGAVIDDSCASVQPAMLAAQLKKAALRAGVRIHEQSTVTCVRPGHPVVVETSRGRVRADRVLLAINAWAAGLPTVGRRMVMVASDTLLTEPLDASQSMDLPREVAVSDARRRLNYFRTTHDGRMLFGKGGIRVGFGARAACTGWGASKHEPLLRSQLTRNYPRLAGVAVEAAWTAPVEYSVTSLPWCASFAGGVSYVTGYSGDGVGPARLMARVAASVLLDSDDPYASCCLARSPSGRLPPEPARWAGARLVLPAHRAVEAAEDDGLQPSRLARRLASIDPTGFVG